MKDINDIIKESTFIIGICKCNGECELGCYKDERPVKRQYCLGLKRDCHYWKEPTNEERNVYFFDERMKRLEEGCENALALAIQNAMRY